MQMTDSIDRLGTLCRVQVVWRPMTETADLILQDEQGNVATLTERWTGTDTAWFSLSRDGWKLSEALAAARASPESPVDA